MSRLIPTICILLIILLILGGYFLWWPKYQKFEDLRIKVANKTEKIKQEEEYFAELDALQNKLDNYQPEVDKINSALPFDFDSSIPALFNFIQEKSAENGLILKDIDLGKTSQKSTAATAAKERIQNISFTVSVSGSYPSLKNFLAAIYNNERLVEVEKIIFSYPELSKNKEIFDFNLQLKAQTFNAN